MGFSTRNLWEMRKFYLQYENDAILQQLVAEITWGQNLLKKIYRNLFLMKTLKSKEGKCLICINFLESKTKLLY